MRRESIGAPITRSKAGTLERDDGWLTGGRLCCLLGGDGVVHLWTDPERTRFPVCGTNVRARFDLPDVEIVFCPNCQEAVEQASGLAEPSDA